MGLCQPSVLDPFSGRRGYHDSRNGFLSRGRSIVLRRKCRPRRGGRSEPHYLPVSVFHRFGRLSNGHPELLSRFWLARRHACIVERVHHCLFGRDRLALRRRPGQISSDWRFGRGCTAILDSSAVACPARHEVFVRHLVLPSRDSGRGPLDAAPAFRDRHRPDQSLDRHAICHCRAYALRESRSSLRCRSGHGVGARRLRHRRRHGHSANDVSPSSCQGL